MVPRVQSLSTSRSERHDAPELSIRQWDASVISPHSCSGAQVLPVGEKDEKRAHWAEAIDFVFHNGPLSAETLGEPELKELCQVHSTDHPRKH